MESPLNLTTSDDKFIESHVAFNSKGKDREVKEVSVDPPLCLTTLLTRFASHSRLLDGEDDQRKAIFCTTCKVGDTMCSLIVDDGSCQNVISTEVVQNLGPLTVPLESRYRLKWLDKGSELWVRKKVLLAFEIGEYKDTNECDVPMQACHVLLGKHWQFDRNEHNGRANTYSIVFRRHATP